MSREEDAGSGAASSVAPLARRDGPEVARLHLAGLPSPLGRRAGERLLTMYYGALASPPKGGVAYVYRREGVLLGYVAGVWDRRRVWLAAWRANLMALPFWMAVEFGFNRVVRRCRQRPPAPEPSPAEGVCGSVSDYELRPLVVAETARGCGIGAELCRCLLDDARERGYRSVFLRVDRDNAPAIRCYEKLGFRRLGTEGPWLIMRVEIRPGEGNES